MTGKKTRHGLGVALSLPLALVACGGGGGGDGGNNGGTQPRYSIGGSVSGLEASKTLALQNNASDDLTLAANGSFTFPAKLAAGAAYAVTVRTQPNGQSCTIEHGSGTAGANVDNVAVSCSTPPASGVPMLVGDWVQRKCTRLSAASSAKNLIRATQVSGSVVSYGNGVVQYANSDCSGQGVTLPISTIGHVEFTGIKTGAGIAAHWGRLTLITGQVSYTVWSKLSANELCLIGDENPTLFADAASVLQTINLSRDGVCYMKK